MAKIRGSSQSQGARGGKTKKKVMPINFEDQIEADRENFSSNLSPLWGGGPLAVGGEGEKRKQPNPASMDLFDGSGDESVDGAPGVCIYSIKSTLRDVNGTIRIYDMKLIGKSS